MKIGGSYGIVLRVSMDTFSDVAEKVNFMLIFTVFDMNPDGKQYRKSALEVRLRLHDCALYWISDEKHHGRLEHARNI